MDSRFDEFGFEPINVFFPESGMGLVSQFFCELTLGDAFAEPFPDIAILFRHGFQNFMNFLNAFESGKPFFCGVNMIINQNINDLQFFSFFGSKLLS